MRYIILYLTVICLSFSASAKVYVSGIWDIPFYSNIKFTKTYIDTKTGKTPFAENDEALTYQNVTFEGRLAESVYLHFCSNKLCSGNISFVYNTKTKLMEGTKLMVADLTKKYGKPMSANSSYSWIAYTKDSKEINIILSVEEDKLVLGITDYNMEIENLKNKKR